MACKVEFLPEAEKGFSSLDASIRKEAANKIDALSEKPFLGKALGNRFGIDLTGLYKLYFAKKKYRIVYRLTGGDVEIEEIVGIGKRDKEEIYRLVGKRLRKRP